MIKGLSNIGWHVFIVGSNANNSVKAGVFISNSNNTSSNANSNIGSRLYLFLKKIFDNLASWQNRKLSLIQFGSLDEELEEK